MPANHVPRASSVSSPSLRNAVHPFDVGCILATFVIACAPAGVVRAAALAVSARNVAADGVRELEASTASTAMSRGTAEAILSADEHGVHRGRHGVVFTRREALTAENLRTWAVLLRLRLVLAQPGMTHGSEVRATAAIYRQTKQVSEDVDAPLQWPNTTALAKRGYERQ